MAQVWLVTGSSRALGHAIVEAGLTAGNKVLATARDIKSLADLSERYGDQVKLFAMDVTDEAAAANGVTGHDCSNDAPCSHFRPRMTLRRMGWRSSQSRVGEKSPVSGLQLP